MSVPADRRASARRTTWFRIVIAGWVIYGVSLFVPAFVLEVKILDDIHSGIEAALWAATGAYADVDLRWFQVPSGFTNLVMLGSLWTIVKPRPSLLFAIVMICLALFNLGWLTEPIKVSYDQLLVGYYLWFGSYALVGFGHIVGYVQARNRRSERTPVDA